MKPKVLVLLGLVAIVTTSCDVTYQDGQNPNHPVVQAPIVEPTAKIGPNVSKPEPVVPPVVRIRGRVVDANGRPIAAIVYTSPLTGSIFSEDGRFLIGLVPREGPYKVFGVTPDGMLDGQTEIFTAKGDQDSDIVVRHVLEVGIIANVVDLKSNPVEGALASVIGTLVSNLTDPGGRAVLKGGELIANHIYKIAVEKPGFQNLTLEGKVTGGGLQHVVVRIRPQ